MGEAKRGPHVAHAVAREKWVEAATEIANDLQRYSGKEAAFRAAMAAFEAGDPDSIAVEKIIRAKWDAPDWSLQSVALACFKAGKAAGQHEHG